MFSFRRISSFFVFVDAIGESLQVMERSCLPLICSSDRRRRNKAMLSSVCFVAMMLSACSSANSRTSPEQAFALSASALSGSDHYRFEGELLIYDPLGAVAKRSQYAGEVTGHGNLKIQWSGDPEQIVQLGAKDGRYRPLQLLEAIQNRHAAVAYVDPPSGNGTVQLHIALKPETAKSRIADNLRKELEQLKEDWSKRNLKPDQRREATAILTKASGQLEEALSTLTVQTRCLWVANNRTWFPLQMTEQTEMAYEREGKSYRENREAVTRFLTAGRNGTIR